jgi:hypothetical protein
MSTGLCETLQRGSLIITPLETETAGTSKPWRQHSVARPAAEDSSTSYGLRRSSNQISTCRSVWMSNRLTPQQLLDHGPGPDRGPEVSEESSFIYISVYENTIGGDSTGRLFTSTSDLSVHESSLSSQLKKQPILQR